MHNTTAVKENQSDSRASKYLTFFLANEEYGVEILKVQEIIGRLYNVTTFTSHLFVGKFSKH